MKNVYIGYLIHESGFGREGRKEFTNKRTAKREMRKALKEAGYNWKARIECEGLERITITR